MWYASSCYSKLTFKIRRERERNNFQVQIRIDFGSCFVSRCCINLSIVCIQSLESNTWAFFKLAFLCFLSFSNTRLTAVSRGRITAFAGANFLASSTSIWTGWIASPRRPFTVHCLKGKRKVKTMFWYKKSPENNMLL